MIHRGEERRSQTIKRKQGVKQTGKIKTRLFEKCVIEGKEDKIENEEEQGTEMKRQQEKTKTHTNLNIFFCKCMGSSFSRKTVEGKKKKAKGKEEQVVYRLVAPLVGV